jgi:hypothetical protein
MLQKRKNNIVTIWCLTNDLTQVFVHWFTTWLIWRLLSHDDCIFTCYVLNICWYYVLVLGCRKYFSDAAIFTPENITRKRISLKPWLCRGSRSETLGVWLNFSATDLRIFMHLFIMKTLNVTENNLLICINTIAEGPQPLWKSNNQRLDADIPVQSQNKTRKSPMETFTVTETEKACILKSAVKTMRSSSSLLKELPIRNLSVRNKKLASHSAVKFWNL